MKQVVIFISLLLILTSFRPNPKLSKSFTTIKSPKTIELIHHEHLYFIRVKLNNHNAILLVDTGAAASLLDINQANEFGFKFNQTELSFVGVGGLSQRYIVTNYKFNHNDSTSLPLPLYAFGANLKFVTESFSNKGIEVVGILGSDFLKTNDAIIDYKRKKLILNNP